MAKNENATAKRTLVEFYDSEYLENIISLLRGSYSEVVYVYFARANEPTERDRDILSEYVRNNFGMVPRFLAIAENTVDCALKSFRQLVNGAGEYDFDITGGSSVFIAAVGALAVGDGGKRIFLHEYDPASGKRVFSYPENAATAKSRVGQLTVDHVLALRGIEILHPEHRVRYRLDQDDLRGEVLRLWDAIRGEWKAWNSFNCVASNAEQGRDCFLVDKQLTVEQRKNCGELLEKLSEIGIISQVHERKYDNKVSISYHLNVPQSALFLHEKAGNILEMLTYVTAVDCGHFADCCTGISLDWDDADRYAAADPYNEIDTVLTRGHIPYFISCKNTEVSNDFLYEIMVMARHYGGRYAIPAMVCTTYCNAHLHARAKEMGVVLIDDIAKLSAREFAEKFISALGAK